MHIKEVVRKQQAFEREKEQRQQAQLQVLILSVSLMVIFGLSGVLFVFYRRKRAAYHVLVLKSQEWAASTTTSVAPKEQSVSEVDLQLFTQLQQLLQQEHLYRDATISIDVIVLRKMTGLSPSDFSSNLQKNSLHPSLDK